MHHPTRARGRLTVAVLVLLARTVADASNSHSLLEQVVPAPTVLGLVTPRAVATSPDGANVYVSANGLLVFSRDPATGALTFAGAGVPILATTVVVSPDGGHVYAMGRDPSPGPDVVGVYARDPGTGLLTFVQLIHGTAERPQSYLVGGTITPDGAHVYLASLDGVSRFARDSLTGMLTYQGTTTGEFVDIAPSADGAQLYAVGRDRLTVFARDAGSGDLTGLEMHNDGVAGVDGLAGAESVTIAPDGTHVYVGSSGEDEIAVFSRDGVSGGLTFVEAEPTVVGGFSTEERVRHLGVSPDGAHVFLSTRTANRIEIFARDGSSGALTPAGSVLGDQVDGLEAPTGLVVAPGGGVVYVTARDGDALIVLTRDAGTGALALLEVQQDGLGEVGPELVASPDSRHVYTIAPHGTVIGFASDPADGTLTRVDTELDGIGGRDGFYGASSAAMTSDGRHLYVGADGDFVSGTGDPGLAIFERDVVSGAITLVGTEEAGLEQGVRAVLVSPDGAYVYALVGGRLWIYHRDAPSGALSAVGSAVVGQPWLGRHIVMAPDGRTVYVMHKFGDLIAAYARDVGTGALTHVQTVTGVVREPDAIAVSHDGRHLYAATVNSSPGNDADPSLTAFVRDPVTGVLTKSQTLSRLGGIFADQLLPSADGRFLYAITDFRIDIGVFRRDVATGSVAVADDLTGSSFFTLRGGVVRPDDRVVYGNAGNVFLIARPAAHCAPAPLGGCRLPLQPSKASILLFDRSDDRRNKLAWKWTAGADTVLGDFGNPLGTTGHTLCVYDASADPQPLLDVRLPPAETCPGKPCWRATSSGFRYSDPESTPDGVKKVVEKAGVGGRASITLTGGGRTVPVPPDPMLPLTPPVRVQLQTDDGECWESLFSTSLRNDSEEFEARSD